MALSLVLLIFGFLSRSVKLFKPFSKAVQVYFRRPISKRTQRVLVWLLGSPKADSTSGPTIYEPNLGCNRYRNVLRQPCAAVFLSFRITTDLVGSTLAEVIISICDVLVLGQRLIVFVSVCRYTGYLC
jgi:hypothetical protein